MKFPLAADDIVMVHVDQKTTHECYVASLNFNRPFGYTRPYHSDNPWEGGDARQDVGNQLGNDPVRGRQKNTWPPSSILTLGSMKPVLSQARTFALYLFEMTNIRHMGTFLKLDDNKLVSQTLINNDDLFVWTTVDMPGVSPNVIASSLPLQRS